MSAPYDWHEHVPTLKDVVIGCTIYAAVLALLVVVCTLRGGSDTASAPAVAVKAPERVLTTPAEDTAGDVASSRLSDGRY